MPLPRVTNQEVALDAAKAMKTGILPEHTIFDIAIGRGPYRGMSERTAAKLLDDSPHIHEMMRVLPGPWGVNPTREQQIAVLRDVFWHVTSDRFHHYCAHLSLAHGDAGLLSNIVLPTVDVRDGRRVLSSQVIVSDPGDVERLTPIHLLKPNGFQTALLDSVLSTTDNDLWRRQRNLLNVAFLPHALSEVFPVSLARARHGADRLAVLASDAGAEGVNINDFLLHEAMAQYQLALLGSTQEAMEATNLPLRTVWGRKPDARHGDVKRAMERLYEGHSGDATLSMPGDSHANGTRGPLGRALQLMEEGQATGVFSPGSTPGNLMLLTFAGFDTTGNAMTWMLYELARHGDVMRELVAEVDAFWEHLGGREPTYADLARLEFMDLCITETLRLWPPAFVSSTRILEHDDVMRGRGGEMVQLPQGTRLLIMNWNRHRSKQLWGPDADSFNPRRKFRPEEVMHAGCPMAASHPGSPRFSPFSVNPRGCLGKNFAQMEMRLIMTQLLRRFSFKLAPPYDALKDVPVDCMDLEGFTGLTGFGAITPKSLEPRPEGTKPFGGMRMLVCPRA